MAASRDQVIPKIAAQRPMARRAALLVHILTALGAGLGLLALAAAADRRFDLCFAWLGLALAVDGVDGSIARRLRVAEALPRIDGARLDFVVDFVTYVVAPLFALWRAHQGRAASAILACSVVACIASAIYFADLRMKTGDNWFRGFPACWNLIVFYAFAFHLPAWIDAVGLLAGTFCLFAPFASVHPLRVRRRRVPTLVATAIWLASAGVTVWSGFKPPSVAQAGLLASALYFAALSVLRGPVRTVAQCAGGSGKGGACGQGDSRS